FFYATRPPPRSTLLPYTTLFRSIEEHPHADEHERGEDVLQERVQGPEPALGRQDEQVEARIEPAPPQNERAQQEHHEAEEDQLVDRKSTRLNSSHVKISYAVFCL